MLPSEDAGEVGALMSERFGLHHWQFTLSATDANRFVVRLCRQVTGRPKILVFNHCYHGSVDETVVHARAGDRRGGAALRQPSARPSIPALTTRVVEFNDLEALERELAHGDVACVLMEPALTNIGIVLPDQGYHEALRELTRKHGTLLVIDETHTLCCGTGGYTGAYGLEPDVMTMGKPIARRHPDRRLRPHRRARREGPRAEPSGTPPTSAASAARSPATPSRSPRSARRSARSSPRRPTSG